MAEWSNEEYSPTNRALLSAQLRARRITGETANVDVPGLLPRFNNLNSQMLLGRQGSGKTHLLLSLQREADAGQVPVYIDLKNISAISDLFESQPETSLSARATRLAIDVLAAIHSVAHKQAVAAEAMDEQTAAALDALADAISQVRVFGQEERSQMIESQRSSAKGGEFGVDVGILTLGANVGLKQVDEAAEKQSTAVTQRGHAEVWLHLGAVREALEELTAKLDPLLILIDDWSSLPPELQPWLADMVGRLLWDTPGCVVKLAAVAADSKFLINTDIGLIGLNQQRANVLDLDNPEEVVAYRQPKFIMELLYQHAIRATLSSVRRDELPDTAEGFAEVAFEPAALAALVEGSEGNPRDALILGAQAAVLAGSERIQEPHVLRATRVLLLDHKDLASGRKGLVQWLSTTVCGRPSRSFYIERSLGAVPILLRSMYDARLVHPGKETLSSSPDRGFTTLYEEWHVDYSFAVYLNEERAGGVLPLPPPPVPYEGIDEAPVLQAEDFQHTASWVIEPKSTGVADYNVEHVWAGGPPAWVQTVMKGLDSGAYLIVDAGSAVEAVPLARAPLRIGRAPEADIRIVDFTVSRNHAKLYKNGDTWRVVDEKSRNGIRFNGIEKPWHELSAGDIMMVGGVVLFYVEIESSEP